MKIIGLTRIRNEQFIMEDTLNHMAAFCDEVIVYDDCSTDSSIEICRQNPIVTKVICGTWWDPNRKRAEWQNRLQLVKAAQVIANKNDWFIYMDADERIEFDWEIIKHLPSTVIGIKMKLFDFYITPEDVNEHYTRRKFIGPEYRNILMAFRNLPTLDYSSPDQREVHLRHPGTVINQGYVKHYGKAVSIEQWEETCQYYGNFFPKYSFKWKARKGKAIHTRSSFGYPLITWEEKEILGFPLTADIQKHNIYENTGN